MRFTLVILGLFIASNIWAQDLTNEATSDEALIQAAEKLIQSAEPEKPMTVVPAESATEEKAEAAKPSVDVPESQVPLQFKTKDPVKAETPTIWRLVASGAVLAVIAALLIFASRRWARPKDKSPTGARIEFLHQHHLGPRKSLALVRVAGEVMLVGITDHNINLIKGVTLIDDELEGLMKKNDFNDFLEDEFSIEDVRSALKA